MTTRPIRLLSLISLAVAVASLGWWLAVRPVSNARMTDTARLGALRQRAASLTARLAEPEPRPPADDPAEAFDQLLRRPDPTAALIEPVARLVSDVRARGLVIETVEGTRSTDEDTSPGAADQPDPRFAWFDRTLSYSVVGVSFNVDYAGLGRFLWGFRDMPVAVEIRALTVRPVVPAGAGESDGWLHVALRLYVFSPSHIEGTATHLVDPVRVAPPPDVVLLSAPEWVPDPFARPAPRTVTSPPAPVEADDVVVASILHSPERRLAIVNGGIVRVGDRVGAALVVDIQPRHIVLEMPGGARRTIALHDPAGSGGR